MLGSAGLQTFLAANERFAIADLYTLTLAGGGVYRYTSADVDLTVGGNTYRTGGGSTAYPVVQRGQIKWATGLEVSTLTVDFLCQSTALIGGTPFATFAAQGGLTGATLLIERLFMATWGDTSLAPVWLFFGDIGDVTVSDSIVTCDVDSALKRLIRPFPRRTFNPTDFPFLPPAESTSSQVGGNRLPQGSGANYGDAVPVVYGRTRIAPSPILMPAALWHVREGYANGSAIKLYSQGIEFALCEGPIVNVGRVWHDRDAWASIDDAPASYYPAGGWVLFLGARPGTAWPYLTGAISDSRSGWYQIPESAPYSFDVGDDTFATSWFKAEEITYNWDPSKPPLSELILVDTITDTPHYTRSGTILTFHSSLHGQSIYVSWGVDADVSGYAKTYDGTARLSTVGLELGQGNSLGNWSFEVSGFYGSSGDANPADILADMLTSTNYGAGLPASMLDVENGPDGLAASGLRRWCAQTGQLLSPAFTEQRPTTDQIATVLDAIGASVIWSEGKLKFRPLGESTVGTYAPYVTARYDLTLDHFLTDDGQPPVEIGQRTTSDTYNTIDVTYLERTPQIGSGYDRATQSYSNSTDVAARGVVKGSPVDAPAITNGAQARRLAEWLVTRSLQKSKTYKFTLGARFICLEPGDIVTLTDSGTGLDHAAAVITSKVESEEQRLEFEAEPWLGLAHPALITVETGYRDGAATNAPSYESNPPSLCLSADNRTVFVAASGAAKDFGWCEVHTSWDNSTFIYRGRAGLACHGQLTGALAVGAAIDSTNTLAVDVTACGRAVPDASSDVPVKCVVGFEILEASASALTSAGHYDLTSLRRGLDGSWSAAHDSGCPFLVLDANVLQLDVSGYAGQTLYVKLVPYNAAGARTGSLASALSWPLAIPAATPAVKRLPWSETFDAFDVADWELLRSDGVLSVQQSGSAGGAVLRCEGETWLLSRTLVPVELAKILALRCRYRQVTAGTYSRFSVGFLGVAADGQTLVGKDGTDTGDPFWALENNAGSAGTWNDVTRFWSGSSSSGANGAADIQSPGVFHSSVRWVRAVIGFNGDCGATGVQELDGVWLSEAVSGAMVVPFSVPEAVFGDATLTGRVIQADTIGANHIQAGAIEVSKLTAGQISDNLWPNGNAEDTAPAGALTANPVTIAGLYCDTAAEFGWIASNSGGDTAYVGTKFRAKTANAGHQENLVRLVPCVAGESFVLQAWCRSVTGSGNVGVYLSFLDSSGTILADSDTTRWPNYYTSSATWTFCRTGGTAPTGTVSVMLRLFVATGAAGRWDAVLCRKMVEGTIVDNLTTSNYSEDGSGYPTAGAKLDCRGTALKVAPGNLQIGSKTLTAFGGTVAAANVQIGSGSYQLNNGMNISSVGRSTSFSGAWGPTLVVAFSSNVKLGSAVRGSFPAVVIPLIGDWNSGTAATIDAKFVAGTGGGSGGNAYWSTIHIGFINKSGTVLDPASITCYLDLIVVSLYPD